VLQGLNGLDVNLVYVIRGPKGRSEGATEKNMDVFSDTLLTCLNMNLRV
jgi:hypothetical protein